MAGLLAFSLAGCGSDAPRSPDESATDSIPEQLPLLPVTPLPPVTPSPSEQAPPRPLPTDVNGCSEVQLPGQTVGEGLAKRYVPGPKVKLCPPQPVIAPATAEPLYQGPSASSAPGL
jgi:hypothetical protein